MNKGQLYDFLVALGERESSSDYQVKNKWGFVGRWQMGAPRLYDLGISLDGWHPKDRPPQKIVDWATFKQDTLMQDMIVLKHVRLLKHYFQAREKEYKIGEEINGIKITLSGLIAGAHLKGIGGVREFLQGKDNTDALGTKISEYIHKFGDYNLAE